MKFIWHEKKAQSNLSKHGISFDEARSVFYDENARLKHDKTNSIIEDRYIILGMSINFRLLVVVHVEIEEETIRIISARKATKNEAESYWSFKK